MARGGGPDPTIFLIIFFFNKKDSSLSQILSNVVRLSEQAVVFLAAWVSACSIKCLPARKLENRALHMQSVVRRPEVLSGSCRVSLCAYLGNSG